MGGASAVVIGSFMPFISTQWGLLYEINPEAKNISAAFGALLGLMALGMRAKESRTVCSVVLLLAGLFGVLGYGGFAYMGIQGFESESDFGFSTHVEFSPGAGLVACIVGCGLAVLAAVSTLKAGGDA